MLKRFFCVMAALALCFSWAHALSRSELRDSYRQIAQRRSHASPYQETPDTKGFSTAGRLTDAALSEALDYLNFIRNLAGLESVSLSPLYTFRSQNGALLLAANDELDHTPEIAPGMSEAIYESAYLGTSLGNIAKFNWMRPEILLDGVEYFVRDDGDYNLSTLGHRRWLLNPQMKETGFGLANAQSGMSYVAMYAVDCANTDARWEYVAWPCEGAFPVELMRRDLAWSVSLNERIYDIAASAPVVRMRELNSGAEFTFDFVKKTGDGFCLLNSAAIGSGSCLIFRPEIEDAGIGEYVQNQKWQVEIVGLVNTDGSEGTIRYVCEMASLNPQDVVNVEISHLNAELVVGESLQLSANVIPAYADDLRVSYASSDPNIAVVDESGLVTAVSAGECRIAARTINGREDFCELSVK